VGVPAEIIVIYGPVDAEQASSIDQLVRHLLDRGAAEIVCDPQGRLDLSVVDIVARLRLITRRRGAVLRLRTGGGDIEDLLCFAGLDDIVDPWESC
jgi:hypothetical protein